MRGELRVTAPVLFGQMHVAPALRDFARAHPAVRLELLLLDRVVDLVEEGIDLAVRIGALPDSSMVAARSRSRRVDVTPTVSRFHEWFANTIDVANTVRI